MSENKKAEPAQLSKGSTWHKWDLHIHTPVSIVHNYGNGSEQETWERFIADLEGLPEEYAALGINDYLFLDGYTRLLREQNENGRLTRFKLFPVVEFRIAKFAGVNFGALKRINLHIIFSDELDVETIKSQFLSGLEQSYTLEANGKKWTRAITRQSVSELGASIKAGVPAEELKKYGPDLVEGFHNLNVAQRRWHGTSVGVEEGMVMPAASRAGATLWAGCSKGRCSFETGARVRRRRRENR